MRSSDEVTWAFSVGSRLRKLREELHDLSVSDDPSALRSHRLKVWEQRAADVLRETVGATRSETFLSMGTSPDIVERIAAQDAMLGALERDIGADPHHYFQHFERSQEGTESPKAYLWNWVQRLPRRPRVMLILTLGIACLALVLWSSLGSIVQTHLLNRFTSASDSGVDARNDHPGNDVPDTSVFGTRGEPAHEQRARSLESFRTLAGVTPETTLSDLRARFAEHARLVDGDRLDLWKFGKFLFVETDGTKQDSILSASVKVNSFDQAREARLLDPERLWPLGQSRAYVLTQAPFRQRSAWGDNVDIFDVDIESQGVLMIELISLNEPQACYGVGVTWRRPRD